MCEQCLLLLHLALECYIYTEHWQSHVVQHEGYFSCFEFHTLYKQHLQGDLMITLTVCKCSAKPGLRVWSSTMPPQVCICTVRDVVESLARWLKNGPSVQCYLQCVRKLSVQGPWLAACCFYLARWFQPATKHIFVNNLVLRLCVCHGQFPWKVLNVLLQHCGEACTVLFLCRTHFSSCSSMRDSAQPFTFVCIRWCFFLANASCTVVSGTCIPLSPFCRSWA